MDKELKKLHEIFLSADLDSEDFEDNLKYIQDIEASIRENTDFSSWQESDISLKILDIVRTGYKDICITLFSQEEISESKRLELFAKKKACIWLASLLARDTKGELESIHSTIKSMLNKIDQ